MVIPVDFSVSAQLWVNLVLLWVGFGAVVGTTAQFVLPAGEPKHVFGTLAVGIIGSCVGPLLISYFIKPEHFQPISPVGFLGSVLTSVVLLLLYRLGRKFAHR